MIFAVGTERGRGLLDRALADFGFQPIPWENYGVGFDTLVAGTAPVFWLFFLLTGISLFVLRFRDPERELQTTMPGCRGGGGFDTEICPFYFYH